MRAALIGSACAVLLAALAPAQKHVDSFADKQITLDGETRRYRLLEPERLETGKRYPLLMFLHGAGERGTENRRQLIWLADSMASPERRSSFPCYLLAVQCRENEQWVEVPWDDLQSTPMPDRPSRALRFAIAALDRTVDDEQIDPDRIYLTGLSMGGYGAWDLACRFPDRFAALAPVCGGGDERQAHRLADLPVWVFHGANDTVVPPHRSRSMVTAISAAGGAARYTEVPDRGHDSWRDAYGEDGVLPWLFAQDRREQGRNDPPSPAWIPWPDSAELRDGRFPLRDDRGSIVYTDSSLRPLVEVLRRDLKRLTGVELSARTGEAEAGDIVLRLDRKVPDAGYRLVIDDGVEVRGRDSSAVAMGATTFVQSLTNSGVGDWSCPRVEIRDAPAFDYRAVMIDCARHPQSLDTLKQVVDLCRFYKIRYLQLHLTDNEAFTFPSEAFPTAATPGRSYSFDELRELEAFARARGVSIVPELDVPGHSAALVRALPDQFGLADRSRNGGLVNMGKESAYDGLDRLVGEMCAVFESSPYFHIGGDEAWLADVDKDPDAVAYMKQHGLPNSGELYRHFIVRMHEIVKRHGKRTIVWEGFHRGGEVAIPKDVIVIGWESAYCRPDHLAADGYQLINASWQPLYIVGGGKLPPHAAPKLWSQHHLYGWHARRWEHFAPDYPSFGGIEVQAPAPVLGAQICVWEQLDHTTVELLRPRIAAVSERLWNPNAGRSFADFRRRFLRADATALGLLRPIVILPRPNEPAPAHRFLDRTTVTIVATAGGTVHYTLDGSQPSPESPKYSAPLSVDATTVVRAQLFDSGGKPVGGADSVVFEKEPPHRVRYSLYRAPATGWDRVPDFSGLEPYERGTLAGLRGGSTSLPVGMVLEASLEITAAGEYRFKLESSDGPARLLINGALVCDQQQRRVWDGAEGSLTLEPGRHRFTVEYAQGFFHTLCRVFYRTADEADWRNVDELLRLP